ncbi:Uncharacterized protein OBRU01_10412, partial [Operophtera brumata]
SAIREEQAADTQAQLSKIGQAAVAEPDAMQRCLTALDVVEGSAAPPRPPSPPMTTDRISYDDTLRAIRILKSGAARDDHQKVVCFTGPAGDEHREQKKPVEYSPGQQPHFTDDPDFCEKYKDAVPEYMRLPKDAYEKVKKLRRETPDISPAAARQAEYPRLPYPTVEECLHPPPEAEGPMRPKERRRRSIRLPQGRTDTAGLQSR